SVRSQAEAWPTVVMLHPGCPVVEVQAGHVEPVAFVITVGRRWPSPSAAGLRFLEGTELEALRQRQRRTRGKVAFDLMASCRWPRGPGSSPLDSRIWRVAGSRTGSSTNEVAVRTPRLRSWPRRRS